MPTIVGRLKDGNLMIAGELNERLPAITDGLVAHYPFDGTVSKYIPGQIRYIRDWLNGSTANTGNHWVEIQAINYSGVNIALGKSGTVSTGSWSSYITDGNTATSPYAGYTSGNQWIQVDLGDLYLIKLIKIWHYYGDGRTYYNTKTEVSDDGVHWYSVFDSAIEGTYAENANGKTINLINPGLTIQPTKGINHTLINDGLYIEEGTANLWSGDFKIYNNLGMPASLAKSNELLFGQPVWKEVMTPTAASLNSMRTEPWAHGVFGSYRTYKANTKYAVSVYWRSLNKSDVVVSMTASNIGGWFNLATYDIGNGWKRSVAYRDGTVTVDKTDEFFFSFYSPSATIGEPIHVDWACPQIEEGRSYATSYTSGSRTGNGGFSLPNPVVNGDYTINFKCRVSVTTGTNIGYATILCVGNYYTNNSFTIMDATHPNVGGNQRLIRRGNAGEWGWSSGPFTNPSNLNVEHMYTVVRNSTDYLCYCDGVLVGSINHLSSTMQSKIWVGSRESGGSTANSKFRDFSIYNRALSQAEISKLYNNKFSIDNGGIIKSFNIIENSISVLKDVNHFPLDYNTNIYNSSLKASEETNLIFENGAAWVGFGYNNLFKNVIDNTFGVRAGNAFISMVSNKNCSIYKHNFDGEVYNFKGWDIAVSANISYTFSFEALVSTDFNGSYTMIAGIEQTGGRSFYYDMGRKGVWQKFIYTFTPTANGNSRVILYPCPGNSSATQGYVLYKNAILVAQPFACPFVLDSNSASSLTFNLNRDIGLDWSKDWSIVYWKKPVGTHWNGLTGYSIESIGCNSNSVGGGYYWWGKNNAQNAIYATTPSSFDPNKYFNQWRMISLIKSGTSLTIKEWSSLEGVYTRTGYLNPAANGMVTQYGYDLKLGGFDNGNPTNAFYKDLIVTQRVLTDIELNDLFRKQMSASKDNKLFIQDNLIEKLKFN